MTDHWSSDDRLVAADDAYWSDHLMTDLCRWCMEYVIIWMSWRWMRVVNSFFFRVNVCGELVPKVYSSSPVNIHILYQYILGQNTCIWRWILKRGSFLRMCRAVQRSTGTCVASKRRCLPSWTCFCSGHSPLRSSRHDKLPHSLRSQYVPLSFSHQKPQRICRKKGETTLSVSMPLPHRHFAIQRSPSMIMHQYIDHSSFFFSFFHRLKFSIELYIAVLRTHCNKQI